MDMGFVLTVVVVLVYSKYVIELGKLIILGKVE